MAKPLNRDHFSQEAREIIEAAIAGIRAHADTVRGASQHVDIEDHGLLIRVRFGHAGNTLDFDLTEF